MQRTDEIERLITAWRDEVTEQARRFDAAHRAIGEVSVTETAAGGAIVLTVDSSGIPTDLRLGDDVGRMKPDVTAAEIMNCLRRAQARLADRVGAVVAETVGDDEGAGAIAEEYQLRFAPPEVDDVPPAPTEENAGFGLSAMAVEPEPALAEPERPSPAPARTADRAPAANDEDEDWAASPW